MRDRRKGPGAGREPRDEATRDATMSELEGAAGRAPRVCVDPASFAGETRAGAEVFIDEERAHHLARVLRVRDGARVVLFDGAGREAEAVVAQVETERRGTVRVVTRLLEAPRAGLVADRARVLWMHGVPKGDKLEQVVREGTELGAYAFWPVYTARSVSLGPGGRPRAAPDDARTRRLESVAVSASAQCGRADVPQVHPARPLDEALAAVPAWATLRIVAWESGGAALRTVLERHAASTAGASTGVAVLVGPEGGLEAREVDRAGAHGFVPVSLGARILRTETVAPALLAMLSYALGDLHTR